MLIVINLFGTSFGIECWWLWVSISALLCRYFHICRDRLFDDLSGWYYFDLYQKWIDNGSQFYGLGLPFFDLFSDIVFHMDCLWIMVHVGSILVPCWLHVGRKLVPCCMIFGSFLNVSICKFQFTHFLFLHFNFRL